MVAVTMSVRWARAYESWRWQWPGLKKAMSWMVKAMGSPSSVSSTCQMEVMPLCCAYSERWVLMYMLSTVQL